jgi:hypothetical protein
VAAVVFGASLITLVGTPHQYGQNWNQEFDLEFGAIPATLGAKLLSKDPFISEYAAGNYGELTVGGRIVAAIGIDPVHGGGYLTLLAGQPPSGPNEIALGAQTMRAIHRRLGQTVQVAVDQVATPGPVVERTMRIVGVAVLPASAAAPSLPPTWAPGPPFPPRCCQSPLRTPAAPRTRPATASSCSATGPAPA